LLRADKARPLLRLARKTLDTQWLRRWWCKKYTLPPTDPRYGAYTDEELLLEFFEDLWESDPRRAMSLLGTVEDDILLETGDAELDDVERRLAAGEDPDEVLKGWGEGSGDRDTAQANVTASADEEFDDDYGLSGKPVGSGLSWSGKK